MQKNNHRQISRLGSYRGAVQALFAITLMLTATSAQAATVAFSGSNGVDDEIFIGDLYVNVGPCTRAVVNGAVQSPSLNNGDVVNVFGKSGDDTIMVANATDGTITVSPNFLELRPIQQVTLGTITIEAGLGNDEVFGSDRSDVILGGRGYDFLFGRNGDDVIVGDDDDGDCLAPGLADWDDCCAELDDLDECEGNAGQDRIICAKIANGGPANDGCGSFGPQSCEVDLCE